MHRVANGIVKNIGEEHFEDATRLFVCARKNRASVTHKGQKQNRKTHQCSDVMRERYVGRALVQTGSGGRARTDHAAQAFSSSLASETTNARL